VKKSTNKKAVSKFEAEGEATELEFDDTGDREFWNEQSKSGASQAVEKRAADEKARGITSRSEVEEGRRRSKVVPIRNDAKAGGARSGSKKKIAE
jgi:hypothetical protein